MAKEQPITKIKMGLCPCSKILRLDAEIEQLKEYAKHKDDCQFVNWMGNNPKRVCTCGLEEVLKEKP